jgi:N-acetylmuramoyl-L-alanine amidase
MVSLAVIFASMPVYANTVYLQTDRLEHDYIEEDGTIYVALDDLAVPLGVTEIFNGSELMLGNTVYGNIRIGQDSNTYTYATGSFDFEKRIKSVGDVIYAPGQFIDAALGLSIHKIDDEEKIVLYPKVLSIVPSDGTLRITSSIPPEFTTFELEEPPRRVIDIKNAYLSGKTLDVDGSAIGISGISALRASQFSYEPPIVRVVLEWRDASVPGHTLYPDSRTLSVLLANASGDTSIYFGSNLLENEFEVVNAAEVPDEPPATVNDDPVVEVDEGNNTGTTVNASDSIFDFETTDPVIAEIINTEIPIIGENNPVPETPVTPPVADEPDLPAPDNFIPQLPDYPEEAVDWSLEQLGWKIEYSTDDNETFTAEIDTPQFRDINDFTLADDDRMRLVIDLMGGIIPGSERSVDGEANIRDIRIGQFQPEIARIVFDLDRVVAYEIEHDRTAGKIIVTFPHGDLGGRVIVIDPGHGGEDPGAMVGNVTEKSLNLEMSMYLGQYLREHGAKVVFTREDDTYVTLADRVHAAETESADLFIVVHNNATEEPTTMQGSLFLYNNPDCMPLYRLAHRGVAARTGVVGLGPIEDERGLYLLRHSGDMPVLFVEAAFMTNALDFARLTDPSRAYSKNIMMGVMDGVLAWFTHRDLPPVEYPVIDGNIDVGIFDLAGRPVEVSSEPEEIDSGSAWDNDEQSDSEASDEEDSGDSADESDDDDDSGSSNERNRPRGSYRFED